MTQVKSAIDHRHCLGSTVNPEQTELGNAGIDRSVMRFQNFQLCQLPTQANEAGDGSMTD